MNPKSSKKSPHVWTKKQLSLLGKISDGAIARQFGLTTAFVYQKRASLGIPPSRTFCPIKWNSKQIALLGKYPDDEVARRLDISRKIVLNKRLALGIQCYARRSNLWHHWTKRKSPSSAPTSITP